MDALKLGGEISPWTPAETVKDEVKVNSQSNPFGAKKESPSNRALRIQDSQSLFPMQISTSIPTLKSSENFKHNRKDKLSY